MKYLISFLFFIFLINAYSQDYSFKKYNYKWDSESPDLSKLTNYFSSEDLFVVDEKVVFSLYDENNQTVEKRCIIKINKEEGIRIGSSICLPESFHEIKDVYHSRIGRFVEHKIPFIYNFKIVFFSARIQKKDGTIILLPTRVGVKKDFWVEEGGNHIDDYSYCFKFENLEVGDILEYTYKAVYSPFYGHDIFYFHSSLPKLNTVFQFKYVTSNLYDNTTVICDLAKSDSLLKAEFILNDGHRFYTSIYTSKNITAYNYPLNMCVGKNLPHVYVDAFAGLRTYRKLDNTYAKISNTFGWKFKRDTVKTEKLYDKKYDNLNKYLRKFDSIDSKKNLNLFLIALCDSLNNLKYMSAEVMNYSGNSQYSVKYHEWLLKGKFIEEFVSEVYLGLINEKKIPYNTILVYDKRMGEINFKTNVEQYGARFAAIPSGNGLIYIMPRFDGLQYHANEIPFYFEGALGALIYNNYGKTDLASKDDYMQSKEDIRFLKTSSSNENENVRTENVVFKINLDSSIIHANIKESLNGQFSTIIRPVYLNQTIDSTVNPVYFKKCTEKPNSKNIKIKSLSNSNIFPFKSTFSCTEDIIMKYNNSISLNDWFSFTYQKAEFNRLPNYDFYVDFKYTDVYNFMFQFDKPVFIENETEFNKSISNVYFEISSKIKMQSESSYLLNVIVKVKSGIIPVSDGKLLLEFVNELEKLNSLNIKLK